MNRSGHEDGADRIIRLAARAAQVAVLVAKVIKELVGIPW